MSEPKPKTKNYRVPMVDHTLRIFEAFHDRDTELSLKDVSARAGVGATSTFRILFTLTQSGYVVKNASTGRYRLGPKIREIAERSPRASNLVRAARPHMQQLNKTFNETVNLGIFQDGEIFYAEILESRQAFRMTASIGARIPVHCSAIGKAIAAFLPKESLERVLDNCPMTGLTSHTITSRSKLLKEFKKIRKQGYSTDDEETELGACCIACPIISTSQNVLGAISLSGPMHRIHVKQKLIIREMMRSTALVSQVLGERF